MFPRVRSDHLRLRSRLCSAPHEQREGADGLNAVKNRHRA